MHFTRITWLAMGVLASIVKAQDPFLVQAHVELTTNPLSDDSFNIQVVSWRTGSAVTVCQWSYAEAFTSDETLTCKDGVNGIDHNYHVGCHTEWAACVTNNGRQVDVSYDDGTNIHIFELQLKNFDKGSSECGCTGTSGTNCLECGDWESCLDNGPEDSNCPRCDHRGGYHCIPSDSAAFD